MYTGLGEERYRGNPSVWWEQSLLIGQSTQLTLSPPIPSHREVPSLSFMCRHSGNSKITTYCLQYYKITLLQCATMISEISD